MFRYARDNYRSVDGTALLDRCRCEKDREGKRASYDAISSPPFSSVHVFASLLHYSQSEQLDTTLLQLYGVREHVGGDVFSMCVPST